MLKIIFPRWVPQTYFWNTAFVLCRTFPSVSYVFIVLFSISYLHLECHSDESDKTFNKFSTSRSTTNHPNICCTILVYFCWIFPCLSDMINRQWESHSGFFMKYKDWSRDPLIRTLGLHRSWWRMLETKCVDDNFEMLVTVLAVFVTNILCPLT